MDTLKERAALEDMHRLGRCPWMLWSHSRSTAGKAALVVPDVQ
jgi:hypothetical protein